MMVFHESLLRALIAMDPPNDSDWLEKNDIIHIAKFKEDKWNELLKKLSSINEPKFIRALRDMYESVDSICDRQGVPIPPFTGKTGADAIEWIKAANNALKNATARSAHVRISQPVVQIINEARGGLATKKRSQDNLHNKPGSITLTKDKSGKTFGMAESLRYWDLVTPSGDLSYDDDKGMKRNGQIQLVLALEDGAHVGALVRTSLTAGMMRAYCAAWWLQERWERNHPASTARGFGYFDLDTRAVLWELYGHERKKYVTKDGEFRRPPRSAEQGFRKQFEALNHIFIRGIGEGTNRIEPQDPERLITYVRNGDGQRRIYRHAHLAVLGMRRSFLQMPVAALSLEPKYTPHALGISSLWRRHIVHDVIRGPGHYHAPLHQLAEAIGEDWKAKSYRYGRKYWSDFVDDLTTVMKRGDLGSIVTHGEGHDAVATLTPSEPLVTVYQGLATAIVERQLAEKAAPKRKRKTQRIGSK